MLVHGGGYFQEEISMTQALWAVLLMSLVQGAPATDARAGIQPLGHDRPQQRLVITTVARSNTRDTARAAPANAGFLREVAACGEISTSERADCERTMPATARAQRTYRE
jgi:hypothetical protein